MKNQIWFLVVVAFVGCGWTSDETATEDPTESRIERELGVAADRASGMVAQQALAEGAAQAAGVDTDQTLRGIEQIGVALGETLDEAGEMPGGEPCLQAYRAMADARAGDSPTQVARDAYLETCRALPADARRCMVPGYVANHVDTCESVLRREDVRGGAAILQSMAAPPT